MANRSSGLRAGPATRRPPPGRSRATGTQNYVIRSQRLAAPFFNLVRRTSPVRQILVGEIPCQEERPRRLLPPRTLSRASPSEPIDWRRDPGVDERGGVGGQGVFRLPPSEVAGGGVPAAGSPRPGVPARSAWSPTGSARPGVCDGGPGGDVLAGV